MTESALYELSGACVRGPLGPALSTLELELHDHAVTALLGPVGSGKSTLLRLLSGRPPSEGWSVTGRWRFRDQELDREPLRDVAWVPQLHHAPAGPYEGEADRQAARARIDAALFCGARVLLLDEPTRGLTERDRDHLRDRLRAHTTRGAAVVITHDVELAREVADEVCLLCDGELVTHRPAAAFFDRPRDDLERQFVRYGTCSAPPPTPAEALERIRPRVPGVIPTQTQLAFVDEYEARR